MNASGTLRVYFAAFATGCASNVTAYFAPGLRTMAMVPFVSFPFSAAFTAAAPAARASFWSVFDAMPGNERCR